MTVQQAWDVILGRKPTKLEELSLAHDAAQEKWQRARKRRTLAWAAEEKAHQEMTAAFDAWLAESQRVSAELRAAAGETEEPADA